jgi:hypothetical protein
MWALAEAIPALWARTRLLACVCPPVFDQGSPLAEAFPTFLASIGFLTYVDVLVFEEVRALSETLATPLFIRLFFMKCFCVSTRLRLWALSPLSTVVRFPRGTFSLT